MEDIDLYNEICTYNNLLRAFKNAREGKTTVDYVIEFEQNLEDNLSQLRNELLFHIYKPKPLKTLWLLWNKNFLLKSPQKK